MQPLTPLVDEFAARLFGELDYLAEGRHAERFAVRLPLNQCARLCSVCPCILWFVANPDAPYALHLLHISPVTLQGFSLCQDFQRLPLASGLWLAIVLVGVENYRIASLIQGTVIANMLAFFLDIQPGNAAAADMLVWCIAGAVW